MRVKVRQTALLLPEHIARTLASTHATGVRPNLENVVVPDIREILFPASRHFHEKLLITLPPITASRPVRALVVLTLMPKDAPNAMGQLGLPHAPEHASVNRREIGRIGGIALVLIDPRPADRRVDHKDRHLLAFHQTLRQLHAPPTQLRLLALRRFPNGEAPEIALVVFGILRRTTVAPNPFTSLRWRLLASIGGQCVRLAVDNIGVATNEIAHGLQDRLLATHRGAKLHFVFDQSRFQLGR